MTTSDQPRCDRCRFWLRDERGEPTYPEQRSICTINNADSMGVSCGPNRTLTTAADFGCVRFQPRSSR